MILFQSNILAKLEYFTNLDFPEIAGAFPFPNATFWGPARVRSLLFDQNIGQSAMFPLRSQ